jgi:hypothetical protein
MFERDGVQYEFHHLGIPTTEIKPNERFSEMFGMHTSDSGCGLIRVQWHRFDADSPLDPLLRSVPHPSFKVSCLEGAIGGKRILLGPYEPIAGYRVAIIEDGGVPIELVETELSDEEIWRCATSGEQTSIY